MPPVFLTWGKPGAAVGRKRIPMAAVSSAVLRVDADAPLRPRGTEPPRPNAGCPTPLGSGKDVLPAAPCDGAGGWDSGGGGDGLAWWESGWDKKEDKALISQPRAAARFSSPPQCWSRPRGEPSRGASIPMVP